MSWTLDDAGERAAAAPRTFFIPRHERGDEPPRWLGLDQKGDWQALTP